MPDFDIALAYVGLFFQKIMLAFLLSADIWLWKYNR